MLLVKDYLKGPYTIVDSAGVETTIDAPVPLANKWLPYDTVDPNTGAVLTRRSGTTIVGIVDYLSRTSQGLSPRGVPLYLFYPLLSSYPPMIVASKSNPKHNVLATVTYEHWEGKWPRAGIRAVIGPVGDLVAERKALLLRSIAVAMKSEDDDAAIDVDLSAYDPSPWDAVFNIDPDGCVDVDDVFCWRRKAEGAFEFGIGIADVSAWIPEGSTHDCRARAAGTTLYADGVAEVPMLSRAVSEQRASLRCDGTPRPALVLVYAGNSAPVWKLCLLTVSRAYTYGSVYADVETCAMLKTALERVLGRPVGDDSHGWVEAAMIEYNARAADCLRNKGGYLRTHAAATAATDLVERTGCAELAWLGAQSGAYADARRCMGTTAHAGLGLDVYCHATSPLRRYADLVNQRWLKYLCLKCPRPSDVLDPPSAYLNERNRIAKRLDRDLWFLANLQPDKLTTVDGFVLHKKTDGRWKCYIPAWKRTISGTSESLFETGDRVVVRAYTNLKTPSLDQRLVCSVAAAASTPRIDPLPSTK